MMEPSPYMYAVSMELDNNKMKIETKQLVHPWCVNTSGSKKGGVVLSVSQASNQENELLNTLHWCYSK